ncbi:MAG: TIGR03936 family radical SAM-associated protein [Lachnospiraceae bacterium]
MKVRIKFRKYGVMKFIGHLDMMRYFQKAMRRGDIPIAFTGGYSPHMVMSFANPLGVGLTSDSEYFDIELEERISSREAVKQLNQVMVEGVEIVSFRELADTQKTGMSIVAAAKYRSVPVVGTWVDGWEKMADTFLSQEQITIVKKTKKSEKEVDIKPMIYQFEVKEQGINTFVATGSSENLKPGLVMDAFLQYLGMEKETVSFAHHRLELYADNGEKEFVTLESMGNEIL